MRVVIAAVATLLAARTAWGGRDKIAAVLGADGWVVRSIVRGDIDGDGLKETVVLASFSTSLRNSENRWDEDATVEPLYEANLFVWKQGRRVYELGRYTGPRRILDTRYFGAADLTLEDMSGDGVPDVVFSTRDELQPDPWTRLHVIHYDTTTRRYSDVSDPAFLASVERVRMGGRTVFLLIGEAGWTCHQCSHRLRVYLVRWDDGAFRVFSMVESKTIDASDGEDRRPPTVLEQTRDALRRRGSDFAADLDPERYVVTDLGRTTKHCIPIPEFETPRGDGAVFPKMEDFQEEGTCPASVWSPTALIWLHEHATAAGRREPKCRGYRKFEASVHGANSDARGELGLLVCLGRHDALLYVDRNGNSDFMDDGPPVRTALGGEARVTLTLDGEPPLDLLFRNDPLVMHAMEVRLGCKRGSIDLHGRLVLGYLADQYYRDFTPHDGIFIDVDGNGLIDGDEYFRQDDQVRVDGVCLTVDMKDFWR